MTDGDLLEVLGLLFGAYGLGWGSGFLMFAVKRGLEMLK